jgi:citrate lyase subunit beta / citryl-CoA lyase
MYPTEALFLGKQKLVSLPVCDHYAGAEKFMPKSLLLQQELGPVFDITFDCEDGASEGNEVAHAQLVTSIIAGSENLILPKVQSLDEVRSALDLINHHAVQAGQQALPIHVLIETHEALADVFGIATLPQVHSLSLGIMDFVSDHYGAISSDAMCSPGQFHHPLLMRVKLEIAADCHAYGKVPSHNVTTDIKDMAIVAADARQARRKFGYTRMWSIHPQQIRAIVQAFTSSPSEVTEAEQILHTAQHAA